MRTLFTLITMFLVNNILVAQSSIGYKYNYEISIEANQFNDSEPRKVVREFIDYIFTEQDEKFNVQTRYSQKGIIYISSNNKIERDVVHSYFKLKNSSVLSFKEENNNKSVMNTEVSLVQN